MTAAARLSFILKSARRLSKNLLRMIATRAFLKGAPKSADAIDAIRAAAKSAEALIPIGDGEARFIRVGTDLSALIETAAFAPAAAALPPPTLTNSADAFLCRRGRDIFLLGAAPPPSTVKLVVRWRGQAPAGLIAERAFPAHGLALHVCAPICTWREDDGAGRPR
jgi:hypothetical protein